MTTHNKPPFPAKSFLLWTVHCIMFHMSRITNKLYATSSRFTDLGFAIWHVNKGEIFGHKLKHHNKQICQCVVPSSGSTRPSRRRRYFRSRNVIPTQTERSRQNIYVLSVPSCLLPHVDSFGITWFQLTLNQSELGSNGLKRITLMASVPYFTRLVPIWTRVISQACFFDAPNQRPNKDGSPARWANAASLRGTQERDKKIHMATTRTRLVIICRTKTKVKTRSLRRSFVCSYLF